MVRTLRVAACVPILAFLASAQSSRNDAASPLIGVYMQFDREPGNVPVIVMERAVENLLKPAGIAVAWRRTRENSGTESFSDLAVLRFKGRCEAKSSLRASNFGTLGETRALASTRVSGRRVMPYTEVECDEVRKAMTYVNPSADLADRQRAFGLALGRVVAHELYHILANSVEHSGEGLGRASELISDLVSSRNLDFDESASRAMRSAFQAPK